MQITKSSPKTGRPLERILAIAGLIACLVVTAILWVGISAQQPMWPLPGLYFIEMAVLSMVCAFIAFGNGDPRGQFVLWGAVGIFTGFSILGAMSVGFFYLPVAIIFGAIAILSDIRIKQPVVLHFGVCLIAGIVQVVLMLAAIRLLF
jgi:hypothetical protein